jgi:6-phospho-3-hexuloisomerase
MPFFWKTQLLIIGSGSGSTKSVVTIAQIAKERNIPIACITTNPNAQIPKLANSRLVLKNPQQVGTASLVSSQPMTSLFEQSLLILLDSITLMLMETLGQDEVTMKDRHNVLE